MKKLGYALKAGVKGFTKAFEPAHYSAGGIRVSCTHCKGELFQEREALLNTTGATFLRVDWLDRSGTALICENCGLIHWFGKKPERISD